MQEKQKQTLNQQRKLNNVFEYSQFKDITSLYLNTRKNPKDLNFLDNLSRSKNENYLAKKLKYKFWQKDKKIKSNQENLNQNKYSNVLQDKVYYHNTGKNLSLPNSRVMQEQEQFAIKNQLQKQEVQKESQENISDFKIINSSTQNKKCIKINLENEKSKDSKLIKGNINKNFRKKYILI
ncbi:hypothetical protein PPERSA_06103 [Pseudocohnilembus persalinus]|uniref:Uncharacterized protein n=1 Tax=Pseudocohnilembus persalinus TaxID=266149 RepID=A0A0V0QVV2_PSEPJ|nr:hypothetical protein PPERSA_06103 [Pseudocohnilembus persalinus]|eukprot:KRX06221.1 hypothetical protein PPERSA_06103 [Pseudocohnilembus persalinus]